MLANGEQKRDLAQRRRGAEASRRVVVPDHRHGTMWAGTPTLLGFPFAFIFWDSRATIESRFRGPIRFFVFEVGFLLLFWFGILRARERLQVPPKPRGYGGA